MPCNLRCTNETTPVFDMRKVLTHTRRVENDRNDAWATDLVKRVGRAMKEARGSRSATWLSDRTAELGYRVPATVISKLDSGHRGSVLGVAELVVLAAALDMPPVALLYPALPDGEVSMLPGRHASSIAAVRWFSGEISRSSIDGTADPAQIDAERDNLRRVKLSRRKAYLQDSIALSERVEAMSLEQRETFVDANPAAIRSLTDLNRADLDRLSAEISNRGWGGR